MKNYFSNIFNANIPFNFRKTISKNIDKAKKTATASNRFQKLTLNMLEKSPYVILITDNNKKLLMHNNNAFNLFNFLKKELVYGNEIDVIFQSFVDPFDISGTSIPWSDLIRFVSGAAPIVVQLQTRDWKQCSYHLNIMVTQRADKSISGYIFILIDDHVLQQEEQLREELFQFTSHDMCGIQSTILALLKLQTHPDHALSNIEFITRIELSVNQTLKLAESLIQLEKVQSLNYQLHEVDFLALVSDVRDAMWPLATSKKIDISISVLDNMVWVNAERDLLWRARSNLISNAIKFSQYGSQIRIEIKLLRQISSFWVSCAIKDNGAGISEVDQYRLFKPFVRVGKQYTEGTGLGLAFVKLVIERHHGKINLTSHIGKGSSFEITLPCTID